MNKIRMLYFEKNDVLHLAISDEPEAGSVEVGHDITAELNSQGELIGIEILNASRFLRDTVLDSVQAKMLELAETKASRPVSREMGRSYPESSPAPMAVREKSDHDRRDK